MTSLEKIGLSYLGWSSFLSQSLMSLAALGAIAVFIANQAEPDTLPEQDDRPVAQKARDDFQSPVWTVAFAAGDTRVASATLAGDVWLKDLVTGQTHLLQRGPTSSARSVTFSKDGRVLAVAGGDSGIRLWDVETGFLLSTLEAEGEPTSWVAFSPNGALLAVGHSGDGSGDGIVALWDWRQRSRLDVLDEHQGGVTDLSFSPDGSKLAAAGSAGVVTIWDVTTPESRKTPRTLRLGTGSVIAAAFSPDGSLIATAGACERAVRLWDAASGAPRGTLPAMILGVQAFAFSPDGTILAVANEEGTATLWDIASARALGAIRAQGRSFYALTFADNGRVLATGGADGTLRLWDVPEAVRESVRSPQGTTASSPGPKRKLSHG